MGQDTPYWEVILCDKDQSYTNEYIEAIIKGADSEIKKLSSETWRSMATLLHAVSSKVPQTTADFKDIVAGLNAFKYDDKNDFLSDLFKEGIDPESIKSEAVHLACHGKLYDTQILACLEDECK